MTLMFDPFAPLFELSREMNRTTALRSFLPPADVVVSDEDVTVVMDVPGLRVENLSIELQDDVLTIRGERAYPYDTGDRRVWQRIERGFGSFERVLRVPKGLDPEQISASMTDGVLTVHLPKPEARKPRRIAIANGSTQTTETIEGMEASNGQRELAGSTA